MKSIKSSLSAFGLVLLFVPAMVTAQAPMNGIQRVDLSTLTGKYEGIAKDETGEQKLTLDLVEESGKFSGTFTTARGSFKILKGQKVDGVLTLEIEKPAGPPGTIPFRQHGNSLVATISEAGKNLTVEFRKILADEISGEWDAAADTQGQAFPFTLNLKLDGEKVTGSSDSQLGHSTVSSGVWKDGTLTLMLDSATGPVGLVATLTDGKLVGDYDYAGQLQGKWVAIRKK